VQLVERREEVHWLWKHFLVSQRRIYELMGVAESSCRYVSRKSDEVLREQLVEVAREKPRWGSAATVEAGGKGHAREPQEGVSRVPGRRADDPGEEKKTVGVHGRSASGGDESDQEWALDFVHDAAESRRKFRGTERDRRVHARVFGAGSGHEFCESERDPRVGADRDRAESSGSNSLRQRTGIYESAFSGVGDGAEDRAGAHRTWAASVQNAHVESFHGKLRDECLNASWFGNLFEARAKIGAWKEEYNEQRPHSSLE
jgi:putative transposase